MIIFLVGAVAALAVVPVFAFNIGPFPVFVIAYLVAGALQLISARKFGVYRTDVLFFLIGGAVLVSQFNAPRLDETILSAVAVALFWGFVPFFAEILRRPKYAVLVIVILSCGMVFLEIYTLLFARNLSLWVDRFGPLNLSVNGFGGSFALISGILISVAVRSDVRLAIRMLCGVIWVTGIFELAFFVGSRAGIAGMIIGMFGALVISGRHVHWRHVIRRNFVYFGILTLVFITLLMIWGIPARVSERYMRIAAPRSDASVMLRVSFAKKAMMMYLDHPVLGGGWDSFRFYDYSQVAYVSSGGQAGRYVMSDRHWPHSFFLKYLGETGSIGFFALIGLALWSAGRYFRIIQERGRLDGLGCACIGWIPGFFVFVIFHDAPGYLSFLLFALGYSVVRGASIRRFVDSGPEMRTEYLPSRLARI